MQKEYITLLTSFHCFPELALGNGLLLRVIFGRGIALAPGKDSHVDIACGHMGQTFVEGALVGGNVVLHRDDLMALHLRQDGIHRIPTFLEILQGRGNIDFGHPPPV
jgi:hypothetical protein